MARIANGATTMIMFSTSLVAATRPWLILATLLLANVIVPTHAFSASRWKTRSHSKIDSQISSTEDELSLINEIRSMRVREIRGELVERQVSTSDCFDKEKLVQRLFQARQTYQQQLNTHTYTPSTGYPDVQLLEVPLYMTSLESGTKVAAVNGATVALEAKDHPYPYIEIEVHPSRGSPFTLNLLLDTACSGVVLRPSVVQKHNLPSSSTGAKLTGAGGVSLTQVESFSVDGTKTFGPLSAAVLDVGGLPRKLDGIIGLSFLRQFAGVDMDFQHGKLILHPKGSWHLPLPPGLTTVAEGPMDLVPGLGIYVADVFLGDRGPVKMLVDSGASDTFLNWKGVSYLSLDRESKFLKELPCPTSLVGTDSVAMKLTHRIYSDNLNLGSSDTDGLSMDGLNPLSIDIGDIALLNKPELRGDGVGGILGSDAFMKCDAVRMTFQGQDPRIQFLQATKQASRDQLRP